MAMSKMEEEEERDGGSRQLRNVCKLLPDYTVPTSQKTAIFILGAVRT
jgi:hypothetical protein